MEKTKRIVAAVLFIAVLSLPSVMYFFLVQKRALGAVALSREGIWAVIAASVIAAVALLILVYRIFSFFEKVDEAEEEEEEAYFGEGAQYEEERPSLAMEEYPELFASRNVSEEEPDSSRDYMDSLARAFEEQRGALPLEEENEEKEKFDIESFLSLPEKERVEKDIFSDLPDTLPEGYTPYLPDEEEWEDEGEEEWEEKRKSPATLLIAAALFILLAFGISLGASRFYTAPAMDGVRVGSLFSEKEYNWSDAESYTVDATVFGEIRISIRMKDNKKAELLLKSLVMTDEGEEGFASIYAYAAYVDERLREAGAEKTVKDEKELYREYSERSDGSFEYIQKIIER